MYYIADDNGIIYAHNIQSRLAAELMLSDILTINPEYEAFNPEILQDDDDNDYEIDI